MGIVTVVKNENDLVKHERDILLPRMSVSVTPSKTWAQVAATPAKPISSSPPHVVCHSTNTNDKGVVFSEATQVLITKTTLNGVYNDNSGRMLPIGYAPKPGELHHEWDWSHDETDID